MDMEFGNNYIFYHFDEKSWSVRCTDGQKIKKNPGQKNSWNKINQFHEKKIAQITVFAISNMAKNQFLNWEKV